MISPRISQQWTYEWDFSESVEIVLGGSRLSCREDLGVKFNVEMLILLRFSVMRKKQVGERSSKPLCKVDVGG